MLEQIAKLPPMDPKDLLQEIEVSEVYTVSTVNFTISRSNPFSFDMKTPKVLNESVHPLDRNDITQNNVISYVI
jgi:hypothetical protein